MQGNSILSQLNLLSFSSSRIAPNVISFVLPRVVSNAVVSNRLPVSGYSVTNDLVIHFYLKVSVENDYNTVDTLKNFVNIYKQILSQGLRGVYPLSMDYILVSLKEGVMTLFNQDMDSDELSNVFDHVIDVLDIDSELRDVFYRYILDSDDEVDSFFRLSLFFKLSFYFQDDIDLQLFYESIPTVLDRLILKKELFGLDVMADIIDHLNPLLSSCEDKAAFDSCFCLIEHFYDFIKDISFTDTHSWNMTIFLADMVSGMSKLRFAHQLHEIEALKDVESDLDYHIQKYLGFIVFGIENLLSLSSYQGISLEIIKNVQKIRLEIHHELNFNANDLEVIYPSHFSLTFLPMILRYNDACKGFSVMMVQEGF